MYLYFLGGGEPLHVFILACSINSTFSFDIIELEIILNYQKQLL